MTKIRIIPLSQNIIYIKNIKVIKIHFFITIIIETNNNKLYNINKKIALFKRAQHQSIPLSDENSV